VRIPPKDREDQRNGRSATIPGMDHEAAGQFSRLLSFLTRLDTAGVAYVLAHSRSESVMVDIALPGWRWEVEFVESGGIEIERYQSVAGVETDAALLDDIFRDL
jgi:hypothetical protein